MLPSPYSIAGEWVVIDILNCVEFYLRDASVVDIERYASDLDRWIVSGDEPGTD